MQKDYVPEHYEHKGPEYVPSLCDGCKWLSEVENNGVESQGIFEYEWQCCCRPGIGGPHEFHAWLAHGCVSYTRNIVTECKYFEP